VFKLSKFRAPTTSQMLHNPAISAISLRLQDTLDMPFGRCTVTR
jgi:hypothetical protein